MSDETDVDQLLENFQKALETFNNIGNVEALITKLDANKNRKLLKKVKHVVSEVHNKVGTVKEKVSKAYKKIKIQSSSESEDFVVTDQPADKDASDKEEDSQCKDVLENMDDNRYSPVVGGKEKNLKRSTRQTGKSWKNKEVNKSLPPPSNKSVDENEDITTENEASLKKDGQEVAFDNLESDNAVNSENVENQVNANDEEDQAEKTSDDENKERDSEVETSLEIIECTPEKPTNKIPLSYNKHKTISNDDSNSYTLYTSNSSFEEKSKDSRKDKAEKAKVNPKESKKSDKEEKKADKSKDGEKDESDSEVELSENSGRGKDKTRNDEENINSDSDESEETSSSKNDKRRSTRRHEDISDEEDKLKETPKKSSSKKNKNSTSTEKRGGASDSDESEEIEETDEAPIETDETSNDEERNKQKESKKSIQKGKKVNKNNGKEEFNSESKKNKGNNISNSEDKELDSGKKEKNRDDDISDDEEVNKLKDKTSCSKNNKKIKHGEKPTHASDNDESGKTDETAKESSDEASKTSDDEDENKEKGTEVSNENDIVTIEDTPKKASTMKNKDGRNLSDSETGESNLTENAVKTEGNENEVKPRIPKIKLVDISKLLAPNMRPLDIMTPSPKTKKSVTFDSSVIILSSSDEETPKKDPKSKDQSPLKSAMRKSRNGADNSDSDSKENNENVQNKRPARSNRIESKVLTSDHSSEDSDFEDSRRSIRLRKQETNLKNKFSKLAVKYGERKSRAATRRLRGDDEHSSDKEDSSERTKKRNKDKKPNSDGEENDAGKEPNSVKNKKRRRKKDILETSSLSEQSDRSDISDSDFEVSGKKKTAEKPRSNPKKTKATPVEADKNDDKFRAKVYISLPLFKCEELPAIYKRKKEIFEVKKLTKMDFTRRTRSTRNGSSKNSDDSDKPNKKRIKLTLKLNKKHRQKEEESDEEGSSTEENKDDELDQTDNTKKNKKMQDKEDSLDNIDPFDVTDSAVANGDPLAEACLEQVKDSSDKEEESDKQSEKSSSDEDDDKTKKKDKNRKKDEENEEDESKENAKDSEKKSHHKNRDEEPKVNGIMSDSDSEERSDKNKKDDKKDKEDESSDDDDDKKRKKKKKGKDWKNDKLLKQKIDSSDSDEDFAKFSKKKDKANSELVRKAKKRIKKSTVISDSDSDEDRDKDEKKNKKSDDDDDYKTEDKSSNSDSDSDKEEKDEESEKEEKKKPGRKRIKRVRDSSSDEDDKSTRKHLRRMIDRDSLSETTKKAEYEEKERKARISEKQKKYNQIFELKADATVDKVVLDFDEKTDKPLLSVSKKLVKQLKPHQVHGVKFMWDACFESLARLKKDNGSGCILAHCMGLGKTLQVITLVHTLLMNSDKTKVEKIMVVCPVNTVLNWKNEFKKWLPKGDEFEVYELVSCKTSSINHERNYIVREWHENGGVLIIGYNMFRTLSNPDNKSVSKKLRQSFQEGLVDPGPDLVVCDEGHLLKNEKTHLSIAMNRIKTPRRIVLTGTPLQNNLKEYWCMVQFIKPNLLGTYKEYMNRFVNPITNGQYTDSTQHDIVVMRRRSHVLHKLLDGVVQRQDYSVLEPYLPPKYEYVLFIQLTEVQIKLYNHYLEHFARRGDGSNRTSFLFTDFQQLQRMCTHPRVLLDKSIEDKEKKDLNEDSESEGSLKDFIDDESEARSTSSDSDAAGQSEEKKTQKSSNTKRKRVTRAQAAQNRENCDESDDSEVEIQEPKEWWQEYIDKEEYDNINHSAKIFLLFEILKECEEIGDKILVFSQSLYTLNCLEYFLQRIDEATQKGEPEKVGGHSGSWAIGLDYFRLDGSSSCDNRASWCDQFNDPENTRARLFLISTKAGGLGINLVAANRVIIFDVSWNPSHDIQSIYRVYRFGQTKPSYIYRFVTHGAMEMKIYERQVTKQAISKRVIDEQQIDRHYSQNDIQELYKTDLEPADRPIPLVPKDVLLGEMLQKYEKTIFKYHEHQSLLENKQDEELNEEERKAAWDEFENEKVVRKTSITNFGGVNLAALQNSMNFSPQLIQVALANIVRKDNPVWSDVQIRGILPALVTQLQMQMSENDFSMYNRVQQEIRLMQHLQAQRMRDNYLQQYQMQQMLQKQQVANQMLGNMNVTPEELRRLQAAAASQNYIHPAPQRSTAGGSGDVIELND